MFSNCYRKMALNLTRTVAKQGIRTFSHQTWISGVYFRG